MLVRVAIDRVVEEIRPDPAEVEQRVPLSGRPVADDLLAVAAQLDQQLEQRTLRLAYPQGELPVALWVAQALRLLAEEELPTASVGSRGSLSWAA